MKRKWLFVVIPLAILGLCIIVIFPMARVWQKLGVEPFCIQGEWPDIHLVSCQGQPEAGVTPMPLPTTEGNRPVPIIVDDDGSPDGMIALLFLLRNPNYDVRAVTISYGEAHPESFSLHVAQFLAAFGRADIPVGYGRDSPLEGTNAFPDSWRQATEDFWGVELPPAAGATKPVPAAALIAQTVLQSEQPVTILVSGSHTNLAEALRLDPGISAKIKAVYIMGGSVKVRGNIHSDAPDFENEVAEWNIYVDPLAASQVFSSGLALHLVPLDATNQVLWKEDDLKSWKQSGTVESDLAVKLVQMMMKTDSAKSVYIWDLVAAVQASQPAVCPESRLALEIVIAPGSQQGRTKEAEGSPNVSVCFEPDRAQVKALVASVFQRP